MKREKVAEGRMRVSREASAEQVADGLVANSRRNWPVARFPHLPVGIIERKREKNFFDCFIGKPHTNFVFEIRNPSHVW